MFQAILRRAQHAVETSIDQVVSRVLMMVPFAIAGGFGTASLAYRLNREFGPEMGNLIMAGIFCVIGLVAVAIVTSRQPESAQADAEASEAAEAVPGQTAASPEIAAADREMISAAVSALAPVAGPQILRLLLRNLPLVAVIVAAVLFLIGRPLSSADAPAEPQPAAQ